MEIGDETAEAGPNGQTRAVVILVTDLEKYLQPNFQHHPNCKTKIKIIKIIANQNIIPFYVRIKSL
jgi:hypothetical protein